MSKIAILPYTEKDGDLWFCLMLPATPLHGGMVLQVAKGTPKAITSEQFAIDLARLKLGVPLQKVLYAGQFSKIDWYYGYAKDMALISDPEPTTGLVVWVNADNLHTYTRSWQRKAVLKIYSEVS